MKQTKITEDKLSKQDIDKKNKEILTQVSELLKGKQKGFIIVSMFNPKTLEAKGNTYLNMPPIQAAESSMIALTDSLLDATILSIQTVEVFKKRITKEIKKSILG